MCHCCVIGMFLLWYGYAIIMYVIDVDVFCALLFVPLFAKLLCYRCVGVLSLECFCYVIGMLLLWTWYDIVIIVNDAVVCVGLLFVMPFAILLLCCCCFCVWCAFVVSL